MNPSNPANFQGKHALVLGVANERSIAWSIAKTLAGAGATVTLTYQGERIRAKVEELASSLPNGKALPCDVQDDQQMDELFEELRNDPDRKTIDALVHSVAFALKEELEGRFVLTSRKGFLLAHEISVYSLIALARRAETLMPHGASILTLSYLGAERAIPNYNVMGVAKAALEASVRYLAADLGPHRIRINAISAGPINTLAARGIRGFTEMLQYVREKAPLKRNVTQQEVADTALFLLSPLAGGITGEVLHVDAGFNIQGM
ncbi:MAG: enoyl-ACP reductase [Verrucomicrobiota bacterium]|jgi:enoyl-[acyl-carrier protein] reductase I|nr:enoyl-ACP reductase [Verrucomicrobiota bacterium]MDD8045091.1 enoyl-ACP reductase [Verrucomicrobiota bacterium]MDD8050813.1 enoyl-ACP reductase [Verrucomicrobiota bacterium]MDI9385393.1 enoyl-ACP reductase [Verrucomicrobiota bacterium]HCF94784.1 NADH-specific enoyl-ACP reductase [Verrucomicrobiota bacterium]